MARTLRVSVRFSMMVGRNHLDEMAEEALDLEGEGMKAFWSGFWRGALKSSLIFGGIGGFCAALYMLKVICEWLYSVYGELGSVIVLTIFTILLVGIIQGCWVYKHYRYYKQLIKDLEEERVEDPDPSCDYDYEIASAENKIKSLLNGNYYYEVCR